MTTTRDTLSVDGSIAADRIEGRKALAVEIYGHDGPKAVRRITYLIETGRLPVGREGKIIVGSRAVLRRWWARQTGGEAA